MEPGRRFETLSPVALGAKSLPSRCVALFRQRKWVNMYLQGLETENFQSNSYREAAICSFYEEIGEFRRLGARRQVLENTRVQAGGSGRIFPLFYPSIDN